MLGVKTQWELGGPDMDVDKPAEARPELRVLNFSAKFLYPPGGGFQRAR